MGKSIKDGNGNLFTAATVSSVSGEVTSLITMGVVNTSGTTQGVTGDSSGMDVDLNKVSVTVPVSGSVSIGNTVPVSGSVNIGNTVPVSGSVGISSIGVTVPVSGSVNIGNTVAVSGSVGIGSVGITVPVSGSVSVGNTVAVSGTVNVGNTHGVSGTVSVGNTVAVSGGVSMADGVNVAQGTTTDAAAGSDLSTGWSIISLLKAAVTALRTTLGVSIADGASVALGATTDPSLTTNNEGTISSKLRGVIEFLASCVDTANGYVKVSLATTLNHAQDSVGTLHNSGLMVNGSANPYTVLTVKRAFVDATASGNTQVVAAVATKKIRVLGWFAQTSGSTALSFYFRTSSAGAAICSKKRAPSDGSGAGQGFNPHGWFETNAGEALGVDLSAAGDSLGVDVLYVEI